MVEIKYVVILRIICLIFCIKMDYLLPFNSKKIALVFLNYEGDIIITIVNSAYHHHKLFMLNY